jgi:hypothetical protein
MKKKMFVGLTAVALMVSVACERENMNASGDSVYGEVITVDENGATDVVETNMEMALVETSSATTTEIDIIQKVKTEEQLANNVYVTTGLLWNNPILNRIASSELRHMNALNILLASMGSTDSVNGTPGVFADSGIQSLYDQYVLQGSVSLEDAYIIGAEIEEMDINDLTAYKSSLTNANAILVLDNLLKGSRNHLRAFVKQLDATGITYTPKYLDKNTYQSIITTSFEKGKKYKLHKGTGMKQGNGKSNGKGNRQMNDGGTCSN